MQLLVFTQGPRRHGKLSQDAAMEAEADDAAVPSDEESYRATNAAMSYNNVIHEILSWVAACGSSALSGRQPPSVRRS